MPLSLRRLQVTFVQIQQHRLERSHLRPDGGGQCTARRIAGTCWEIAVEVARRGVVSAGCVRMCWSTPPVGLRQDDQFSFADRPRADLPGRRAAFLIAMDAAHHHHDRAGLALSMRYSGVAAASRQIQFVCTLHSGPADGAARRNRAGESDEQPSHCEQRFTRQVSKITARGKCLQTGRVSLATGGGEDYISRVAAGEKHGQTRYQAANAGAS